jgi:hypothetical protein
VSNTLDDELRERISEELGLEPSMVVISHSQKGGRERVLITIRDWRVMAQDDVAETVDAIVQGVLDG